MVTVKMVRTAFFNLVGLNVITDKKEGASPAFHFFGIELGAARADAPAAELDFAGSRGNIVFGNVIRGSHYAGSFYAEGSTDNDAFDNTIFGATNWAQEQVRPQANPSLNNLSNLPSRNIGSGLDGETRSVIERGHLCCHCLLVEGDHGLTLVDTGYGMRDAAFALA